MIYFAKNMGRKLQCELRYKTLCAQDQQTIKKYQSAQIYFLTNKLMTVTMLEHVVSASYSSNTLEILCYDILYDSSYLFTL